MEITELSDHVLVVKKPDEKFPKKIIHKKQDYIYGTQSDKGAVYYLKSWFYSN